MGNVHVEIEAEELIHMMDQNLSDATLLDLMMAIKRACSESGSDACNMFDEGSILLVFQELNDKIGSLVHEMRDLNVTMDDIDRQLAALRKANGRSDALLYP